jgi:hypothetical protein
MTFIYVVLDDGLFYPTVYTTYESAWQEVIKKYKDTIYQEKGNDVKIASDVDKPENKNGTTKLYIKKGIFVTIQRYEVPESDVKRKKII